MTNFTEHVEGDGAMSDKIEQGVYEHFKGGQYDVIGTATSIAIDLYHPSYILSTDANPEIEMVVYVPLNRTDRRMRVRSVENFTEHIVRDIERDGKAIRYEGPRFRKIFGNQKGPA